MDRPTGDVLSNLEQPRFARLIFNKPNESSHFSSLVSITNRKIQILFVVGTLESSSNSHEHCPRLSMSGRRSRKAEESQKLAETRAAGCACDPPPRARGDANHQPASTQIRRRVWAPPVKQSEGDRFPPPKRRKSPALLARGSGHTSCRAHAHARPHRPAPRFKSRERKKIRFKSLCLASPFIPSLSSCLSGPPLVRSRGAFPLPLPPSPPGGRAAEPRHATATRYVLRDRFPMVRA
jgi:hypothetical protein